MRDYAEIIREYPADFGDSKDRVNAVFEEYSKVKWSADDYEWEKIADAAKVLCDAVNREDFRTVAAAFYLGFNKNHRTLQNQAMAALIEFMRIYKDTAYDLRNHAAVVAAAQIAQFADDQSMGFPHI